MTKQEISTILTESGIGGLEKEIKKEVIRNDKWWFLLIFLTSVICCTVTLSERHNNKSDIHQFKFDYATKVGKQYGIAMDSLVKIADSKGIENCTK